MNLMNKSNFLKSLLSLIHFYFTQKTMGIQKPEILPSIQDWIHRCQLETDPRFSEINKTVLKYKKMFVILGYVQPIRGFMNKLFR